MEPVTTTNIQTTTQSGIYSILEPPFTEYSNSSDSFSPDYQFDELFNESDCQKDLGESPVYDYLLDQEIGRVTLQLSPDLPLCQRVPYKEMLKFGINSIGPSRPLLPISEAIDWEEIRTSHVDSLPLTPETAAVSPEVAAAPKPTPPV